MDERMDARMDAREPPRSPGNPDGGLEAALRRWARVDPPDPAAVDRLERHAEAIAALAPAIPGPRAPGPAGGLRTGRWLAGGWFAGRWRAGLLAGATAASLALALLVRPPAETRPDGGPAPAGSPDSGASFALLYTPATDEDSPL